MKTKYIFLFVIVILNTQVVLGKNWGSKITPELEKFCKEAGGEAKVFPDSCSSNTCELLKHKLQEKHKGRPWRCLPSTDADCDCGPQRCLENTKCVTRPKY